MSYKEKMKVANIVSSVVITTVYAIIMYQRYLNGTISDENIFRFWAVVILIFIPISIVARIIILILFNISNAVVETAKGNDFEDDMDDITDERDKLIERKANYIGMFVFSAGFILALVSQLFDVSNHLFFIILVVAGFMTDILSESLAIVYYRRGV